MFRRIDNSDEMIISRLVYNDILNKQNDLEREIVSKRLKILTLSKFKLFEEEVEVLKKEVEELSARNNNLTLALVKLITQGISSISIPYDK